MEGIIPLEKFSTKNVQKSPSSYNGDVVQIGTGCTPYGLFPPLKPTDSSESSSSSVSALSSV